MQNAVAIDLETKGLIEKGKTPEIICVSWAGWNGEDWESHCEPWTPEIKIKIQWIADNNTIVYHNAGFDHRILQANGVTVKAFHDTQLMSYVLFPNATHGHALAAWGEQLEFPKLTKPWEGDYPTEFTEELQTYCRVDAELTIKLFHYLKKIFLTQDREAWSLYNKVELPYSLVIQEMEETGMFVNTLAMADLKSQLEVKLHEIEGECRRLFPLAPGEIKKYKKPHPDKVPPEWSFIGEKDGEYQYRRYVAFNPSSNAHKAYALRQQGWEASEMTPTGEPKVSRAVLEKIDLPIAELFVEHNTTSKIVGSFLNPFYEYTDEYGVLRGRFNQTVTLTGRLSSSNPNLQNIPRRGDLGKQMRNLITTPSEDVCLFNGDLSNIEARVLAWMLDYFMGESSMADIFIAGADLHSSNAANWGVDRDAAKTLFFAILYGAGAGKIAKQLKKPFMEAKQLIDRLNKALPAMQELKEEFWKSARKNNGILHTLFGRRLIYPDLLSHDDNLRSAAERQIFNAYIQGTAGDILKALTIESIPTIHVHEGRIAAAVHDEILGYVIKKEAETLCQKLSHIFSSSQFIKPVPIIAEFHYGSTWGEIH